MSYGKKWKMTPKQMGKQSHSRRYRYHGCGGKNGKCRFQHFRHKKWFKCIDGKVSMKWAASRDIWYWD